LATPSTPQAVNPSVRGGGATLASQPCPPTLSVRVARHKPAGPTRMQLMHLSVLRDYLDLEFRSLDRERQPPGVRGRRQPRAPAHA